MTKVVQDDSFQNQTKAAGRPQNEHLNSLLENLLVSWGAA